LARDIVNQARDAHLRGDYEEADRLLAGLQESQPWAYQGVPLWKPADRNAPARFARWHEDAAQLVRAQQVDPAAGEISPTYDASSEPEGFRFICARCGEPGQTQPSARDAHEDLKAHGKSCPEKAHTAHGTTNRDNSNNGGTTMTAPTGEAVNYETTIAELDAQERQAQEMQDTAAGLRAAAEQMRAHADAMQQQAQAAVAAAQSTHDHLAARSLDGQTLAATGDAATAMDPNQLDALYDQVEQMETQAAGHEQQAEQMLASIADARSTIEEKYGDAHNTVAAELGGDASFLDSGGGTTAGAPSLQTASSN
jgi:hypothetical protein